MSSLHQSLTDPAHVRSLQQQIESLQRSLEEQNDAYFELSATMASVQAEADYKVAQIRKQVAARPHGTRGIAVTPAMTGKPIVSGGQKESAASIESRYDSLTQTSSLSYPLIQHLLQQPHASSLPTNLLALLDSPASNPYNATSHLLWQLVDMCLAGGDTQQFQNWQWLNDVLTYSAWARRELRNAMNGGDYTQSATPTSHSRISGGGDMSWNQMSLSIREPLGAAAQHSSTASTGHDPQHVLYTRQVASRLQEELLSLDAHIKIQILASLLSDVPASEMSFWQRLLCGSSTAPIVKILLPLLVSSEGAVKASRSSRTLLMKDSSISPPSDDGHLERATQSLKLLRDCGGWLCVQELDDLSHDFLGILLDLLETKYTALRPRMPLVSAAFLVSILQVIQYTLCRSPLRGVRSMRTQLAMDVSRFACSGVGVVVQVFYRSAVLNWEPVISSECIRILHVVLKQIQQERQRADESSSSFVSFLSVVSEHEHFYRAACHEVLQRGRSDIARLLQLQVEEIAMDEEEEEDLKIQRREAAS